MNISPIGNLNSVPAAQIKPHSYAEEFSKVLDNLKKGKPVDYDEEAMRGQKTQTMTQILSDGSTLVTVFDESGRVLSQSKTMSINSDPNAQIVSTQVENNFGLGELAAQSFINV